MSTDAVQQPVSKSKRRGLSRDRTQLLAIQQAMAALALDDKVSAHVRATCARAWTHLQETKRVIDGKPLPGMLRPEQPKRKRPPVPFTLATRDGPDVA